MRTQIVSLLMLAVFWAAVPGPALAQKPNLNPDLGGPEYAPFTLFSPDSAGRETDQDRIILVFHGFASAVPNGTYKRIRKRMLDGWTTIGVNYDPLKPKETAEFIRTAVADRVRGRDLTVAGSSQGGWWAAWTSVALKADKAILINPITDPPSQLAKYIGKTKENKRRAITMRPVAENFTSYREIASAPSSVDTLVILARDDKSIDYKIMEAAALDRANHQVVVYDVGGHTINLKKHPALDQIEFFLKR